MRWRGSIGQGLGRRKVSAIDNPPYDEYGGLSPDLEEKGECPLPLQRVAVGVEVFDVAPA